MQSLRSKTPDISRYSRFVFDCDGVILDSNSIKSEAFFKVAEPFGRDVAEKFVEYHVQNGGVSRFEKFKILICEFLKRDYDDDLYQSLLESFSNEVREALMNCSETSGVRQFLEKIEPKNAVVASGGAEAELRDVFKRRQLDRYFDHIFGSPNTKDDILSTLGQEGWLIEPSLFVGDSRLDYEVACRFKMDFMFLSKYTEFDQWESFFRDKDVFVCESFERLI